MARRLPKAFFWIDQNVIRSGVWKGLSPQARLAYVALAASCDREGVSIWSAPKLMEISGCVEREEWSARIVELEQHRLIEAVPGHVPPAIRVMEVDPPGRTDPADRESSERRAPPTLPSSPASIIVHTHTTIQMGAPTESC